ncbi:MAG: CARDB domain-containing protein, partial [Candidatus Thermoplasmatota archaeon]|nr:CARDB domain-containing protein [Candidatus Thermoplasmatota archaeon]
MGLKYQAVACQITMRVQILLLVATVTVLTFAVQGSGEAVLQALSLEYGYDLVEGEVPVTLVESGLDNGTMFRFLILDDYSEAPENWSQPWFDDSNWSLGAAPFGDREYNNVNPNTIWDTSGSSPFENDALLIRHSFDLPAGTIVSAEINVAFANYCTPFLNGNLIYSERGGNSHGMEYWNDDGTESLAPELFNSTDNVLAVYARDYVYGSGGQNRQWIDLQITGGVDAPLNTTTEPVTLGDQLTLVLNIGNDGNSSADLVTVKLQADGETVWQQFLPSFAANSNATILVDWTPQRLGDILLNLSISSESNESNYLNNSFENLLHIHHWEYMLEYSGDVPLVNSSGAASFSVTVRNTGDLADVLTFTTSEKPQGWGVAFHPEWMELAPGESRELLLNVSVPEGEINGDWNF